MRRFLNRAILFAVYGLAAGVYFREFTKFNDFTDRTMLSMAHVHILSLGLAGYLLIALLIKVLNIAPGKKTRFASGMYSVGILLASLMMLLRGTMEVAGLPISEMTDGMIAGLAGLGHIMTAVGLLSFLSLIKRHAK